MPKGDYMREIMTVLGPIIPKELGFCQCHEHILLSKGRSFELNPTLCVDDISKSSQELLRYRRAGGRSLVDAQPGGCNRMTKELAKISAASGVHIIASTGFHKLIFYPKTHWLHRASVKQLTKFFTEELENGMYTDIDTVFSGSQCPHRAGIIKTALDTQGLTPEYQRLFTAAANASKITDKSLMIHVEQGVNPTKLLDFLLTLNVNPTRLIFCHMDRACADKQLHLDILKHGCYLEYDTIGRLKYHSDEEEIKLIKTILSAGYTKQLLYSLDTTRERLKSYNKNAVGLDYILTTFNQLLLNAHVTQEDIHLISVKNCVGALSQ